MQGLLRLARSGLVATVIFAACGSPLSPPLPVDAALDADAAAGTDAPPQDSVAPVDVPPDAPPLDAGEVLDADSALGGDSDLATGPDPCKKLDCNDWNVCTTDGCVDGACVHEAAAGSCDDWNACTIGDTCLDGVCAPGTAKICQDGLACTLDKCLPCKGCDFPIDVTQCDDGDGCTLDGCTALGCSHTPTCDDGSPCTLDACVALACKHTFTSAAGCCQDDFDAITACDDKSPCTTDYCQDQVCHHTKPTGGCCMTDADCDDSEACTTDSCDLSKSIGDHFACKNETIAGCMDADCVNGVDWPCNDGTFCTIDFCNVVTKQCQHKHSDGCCSDDMDCYDGNPCVFAKCAANGHCFKVPLTGLPCSADGKVCSECGECVTN